MTRRRAALLVVFVLAVALALGLCARHFGVSAVRVAGASMRDTLRGGDVALVTRFDYLGDRTPARGDVVECRFPGRSDTYIKRVVALPGDAVRFSGGRMALNGVETAEPYVSSPTDDYGVALGEDEYLLLGDNRAESYDSRMADMGPVRAGAFLGRVRWIIWPLDRIGPVR